MADGLEHYASPLMRMAIFRRLFPGAQVEYDLVPIEEAFPEGHREGDAFEAIRCTIHLGDGTYVEGFKEIDVRDKRNRPIEQTPENFQKDQTKALGRALRDAGIPMHNGDLGKLMTFIVQLDSKAPVVRTLDRQTGEIVGYSDPDVDEEPVDAEPSPQQLWVAELAKLSGADKNLLSTRARALEPPITNVMRPTTEQIEVLEDLVANLHPDGELPEEEPGF